MGTAWFGNIREVVLCYGVRLAGRKAFLSLVIISLCMTFFCWPSYSTEDIGLEPETNDSNVVIVSAFFDLGSFQKGESNQFFDPPMYIKWAESFAWIRNPVVIYTDSDSFANHLRILRKNYPVGTRVVLIRNRTELWSFKHRDVIERIYQQPGYPQHHPNTVLPEYSCSQHAKLELTARAAEQNLFRRKYYAWLDIGYYRDMVEARNRQHHEICVPPKFNISRIGYNLVYRQNMMVNPESIIRRNVVWVGGGFFIGTKDVMVEYAAQYRRAVQYLLDKKLMSTDQQVIYFMFTGTGRKVVRPKVELQLYEQPSGHNGNPWFYLGYLCLHKLKCAEEIAHVNRSVVNTVIAT